MMDRRIRNTASCKRAGGWTADVVDVYKPKAERNKRPKPDARSLTPDTDVGTAPRRVSKHGRQSTQRQEMINEEKWLRQGANGAAQTYTVSDITTYRQHEARAKYFIHNDGGSARQDRGGEQGGEK